MLGFSLEYQGHPSTKYQQIINIDHGVFQLGRGGVLVIEGLIHIFFQKHHYPHSKLSRHSKTTSSPAIQALLRSLAFKLLATSVSRRAIFGSTPRSDAATKAEQTSVRALGDSTGSSDSCATAQPGIKMVQLTEESRGVLTTLEKHGEIS